MKTIFLASLSLLAACSVMPEQAAVVVHHDLGASLHAPAGRAPLPLKRINVSAAPVVQGLAMHYREAAAPTRRGVYARHRWAAPPPALLRQSLQRLLPLQESGRCLVQLHLSDFILEVDAAGAASALLAAELQLKLEGQPGGLQRVVDQRVGLPRPGPGEMAQGLAQAVDRLDEIIEQWLDQPAARALCTP